MKILKNWEKLRIHNKFDGTKFEELVKELLSVMFQNIEWKPTKHSWDGNKDFVSKGFKGEEKWAECKCYQKNLDLKILAPTLIMSSIHDIKEIYIFSYSKINKNTRTKIISFANKRDAKLILFEDESLENLILKYRNDINFDDYFYPISIMPEDLISLPDNDVYYFNNRLNKLLNKRMFRKEHIKLNDLIELDVILFNKFCNDEKVEISFKDASKNLVFNASSYSCILKNGEIKKLKFFITVHSYVPILKFPAIYLNNKLISSSFHMKCDWLLETPLIGNDKQQKTINKYITSQQNNVVIITGTSGVGKTKFMKHFYLETKKSSPFVFYSSGERDNRAKDWIRQMLADIFDLPLLDMRFKQTTDSNNKELITQILYNYDFDFSLHKEKVVNLLFYNLISNSKAGLYLFFDNMQCFDDLTTEYLQEIIQKLKYKTKTSLHIIISFNTDYIFSKATQAFYTYLNQENDDIAHIELTNFSNNSAKMYIDSCFDAIENSYTFNNMIKEKLLNISHRNPFLLEQLLLNLLDYGVLINEKGRLLVTSHAELDKVLNFPIQKIDDIINKRLHFIYEEYPEKINQFEFLVKILVFMNSTCLEIFKFCDIAIESVEILLSKGIISFENQEYHFRNQLIQRYFKLNSNILSENEIKALTNAIERVPITNSQAYLFILHCLNRTCKQSMYIDMIKNLNKIDNLDLYTTVCKYILQQYNSLDKENLQILLHQAVPIFKNATCNMNITNSFELHKDFYYSCLKFIDITEDNVIDYFDFIIYYMNILLEIRKHEELVNVADCCMRLLNSPNSYKNYIVTYYKSRILNRKHIAINRTFIDVEESYCKEALLLLEESKRLSIEIENIDLQIQNEIDFGYLYNHDIKYKECIKNHWFNAYELFINHKQEVPYWETGVLLHYMQALLLEENPNYHKIDEIMKQCFNAYNNHITSYFFYLKARLLELIINLKKRELNEYYLEKTNKMVSNYGNIGMLLIITYIFAIYKPDKVVYWEQLFYHIKTICKNNYQKAKYYPLLSEAIMNIKKLDSTFYISTDDIENDYLKYDISTLNKMDLNKLIETTRKAQTKSLFYDKNKKRNFPWV